MSPEPLRVPCPSVSTVEEIGAVSDPVLRNVRITLAYHDLSAALSARLHPGANWCTFATWASRQAGRTIRGEDLPRKIEDDLGRPGVLAEPLARIGDILRPIGRALDEAALIAAVRDVFSPIRMAERAGDAVARGNLKVFQEIARAFAVFVPLVEPAAVDAEAIRAAATRTSAGFTAGDPPSGQDLLRAAFEAYARALSANDAPKAECLLLANLRIGFHEQTRLQPEIEEALDVAVPAPGDLGRALRRRLGGGALPNAPLLDEGIDALGPRLVERVRHIVRMAITSELMSLDLPGGPVRLGADLSGRFPPSLERPVDPELVALLARIDPTPAGLTGSGAHDWANLRERMGYIADLFRSRQEDASLAEPPFDTEQIAAIRQGRMPRGSL